FMRKFAEAGGTSKDLQKVIERHNNALAPKIIEFIRSHYELCTIKQAEQILGDRMVSPFPQGPLDGLIGIDRLPYPPALLTETRDQFVLIPISPISLKRLCTEPGSIVEVSESAQEYWKDWWDQRITPNGTGVQWTLFGTELLGKSGLSYKECRDLAEKEDVQCAYFTEILFCMQVYHKVTGRKLLGNYKLVDYSTLDKWDAICITFGDKLRITRECILNQKVGVAKVIRPETRNF
ncbi:MAG: hypothetical protein U0517_01570, partial [Candidatus Andersenbacteria bacterium]